MDFKGILNGADFMQIGYVCNDIEATKKQFEILLGQEASEVHWFGEFEVMQTTMFGELQPEANGKQCFFNLTPGVTIELIEPNKAHSVWRDELDRCGEGIHHLGIGCKDGLNVAKKIEETFGAKVEQYGTYGDGSGRYIYIDCFDTLKCRIELLESF